MGLADRFQCLLDLVIAWDRDEQRLERSSRAKPSAMAPLLGKQFEQFLEELGRLREQEQGSALSQAQQSLAHAYDQAFVKLGPYTPARMALNRLDDARFTIGSGLHASLKLEFLRAGCWLPVLPCASHPPKPYGPYAKLLDQAVRDGHAGILEYLVDWPGSGPIVQDLIGKSDSGVSLPSRFFRQHLTGWAWAVRNTSLECLQILLAAGADANATDTQGNPVLAYATKPSHAQALLAAGADPLHPRLPLASRCQAVLALWNGWSLALKGDAAGELTDPGWARVVDDYLAARIACWPAGERMQATAPLVLEVASGPLMEKPVDACRQALVKRWSHQPDGQRVKTVTLRGRRWSMPAAISRRWFLEATVRQLPGKDVMGAAAPPGDEVPTALEAAFPALWELALEKPVPRRISSPPSAVANALAVLLEDQSCEGHAWEGSFLEAVVGRTLDWAATQGTQALEAMSPVLRASLKTATAKWPGAVPPEFPMSSRERFALPVLRFMAAHPLAWGVEFRARCALLVLSVCGWNTTPPDPEIRAKAIADVAAAVRQGLDLAQLEWPVDGGPYGSRVPNQAPGLAEAIHAAQASRALEAALEPGMPAGPRGRM